LSFGYGVIEMGKGVMELGRFCCYSSDISPPARQFGHSTCNKFSAKGDSLNGVSLQGLIAFFGITLSPMRRLDIVLGAGTESWFLFEILYIRVLTPA
jgi:hypothetical protein